MLNLLMKMARVPQKNEMEENEAKLSSRPRPKCRSLICVGIVATLFFVIGMFQTFLGIFYVRAASRNPILILGPMFAGLGVMLYVSLVRMCLDKFRNQRVSDEQSTASQEENYPEQLRALDLKISNSPFPPMYVLAHDELIPVNPEEMKMLLKECNPQDENTPSAPPCEDPNGRRESCTAAVNLDNANKSSDVDNEANADVNPQPADKSTVDAAIDSEDLLKLLGEAKGISITEDNEPSAPV